MQTPPRVLAFGAHPDDAEFYYGGTLALLREAGWTVGIATVTGGCGGSREHDRDETRRIRLAEAAEATGVIDGEYFYAGGQDMDVDYCHELRVKVVHVFRQFCPDVVITQPPSDYHPDHEETSRLVRAACFFAPIPNFAEQALPPIDTVPYLYYAYARKSILGGPAPMQFCVDVSSVAETKERMLKCHRSQRDWILAHHGHDDYIRDMHERNAACGKRAGLAAGEGFCQHLGSGYPQDNVLAEALGEKVRTEIT